MCVQLSPLQRHPGITRLQLLNGGPPVVISDFGTGVEECSSE